MVRLEVVMYVDSVVVAGIITVVAVLMSLVVLAYYGYRRLREEEKRALKVEVRSAEKPRG
jgi:hypothetical protein